MGGSELAGRACLPVCMSACRYALHVACRILDRSLILCLEQVIFSPTTIDLQETATRVSHYSHVACGGTCFV